MKYDLPGKDGGRTEAAHMIQSRLDSALNSLQERSDSNGIESKQASKHCEGGICKIVWKPLRNKG